MSPLHVTHLAVKVDGITEHLFIVEEESEELHNHRCSTDHPPCPACELLEEREHEREAGP